MNIYFIATKDEKVFGVGMTKRHVDVRHGDRDWGKVNGFIDAVGLDGLEFKLVKVWYDVDLTDHQIHAWLKKQPGIRKFNEFFTHTTTLDVVLDMVERQFFSEYEGVDKEYRQMFPHQQAFVDKARPDYTEFLLAAKCRAGKSTMVLSHVIDRGHKVTLVTSRFCSPFQSWHEDTNEVANFDNLVAIDLSSKDYLKQIEYWLATDKQLVLCSTVQGLVRRLDNLPGIDLLVYDEAHIGDRSSQFLKVRDRLSDTPCLKVSGTAYDQLWDTTEANRFVYDYYQEQLDVKAGIIQKPSMSVVLAKYESAQYANVFGDDPDAMRNVFNVRDGQFVDPFLVKEFVAKYFDTNREVRPANRLLHDSNHIYMCMPSVTACHLLQEVLDPIIPSKVVTGDTQSDADDIDQFVREHNRTVCLTYSANVLGVTQSLWDTVVYCREGNSIQFWTQFAFRAGSGDHNWRVIDFVPTRALESLRETFVLAADLNPVLSEYDFTDFVPIYEWDAGFEDVSIDRVNDILAADPGSAVRLMTGGTEGMNLQALLSVDFDNFQDYDAEVTKQVLLNDEANNGDNAKKRVSDFTPAEQTELQQKIKTVQYYLSLVPEVIFREYRQGNTVMTIADVTGAGAYAPITGDKGLLQELLDAGILSSRALTRRVAAVVTTVASAGTSADVLMELEVATGTQQGLSVDLLSVML